MRFQMSRTPDSIVHASGQHKLQKAVNYRGASNSFKKAVQLSDVQAFCLWILQELNAAADSMR